MGTREINALALATPSRHESLGAAGAVGSERARCVARAHRHGARAKEGPQGGQRTWWGAKDDALTKWWNEMSCVLSPEHPPGGGVCGKRLIADPEK